jgi:hypothetical protein
MGIEEYIHGKVSGIKDKDGKSDLPREREILATGAIRRSNAEKARQETNEAIVGGIKPETDGHKEAQMENYEADIASLNIEVGSMEELVYALTGDNPDSLQLGLYKAKFEDVDERIKSLDKIYKNDGMGELNDKFENVKVRFAELQQVNMEYLEKRVGGSL